MAPLIERVAAASGVRVVDLRVDEEPELVERNRVRSVPTLIGVRDGAEVGRLVGLQSVQSLEALFSAVAAEGEPVVARVPRSLVVTRAMAGLVVTGAGMALGAEPLLVIGAALMLWAVLGIVRR